MNQTLVWTRKVGNGGVGRACGMTACCIHNIVRLPTYTICFQRIYFQKRCENRTLDIACVVQRGMPSSSSTFAGPSLSQLSTDFFSGTHIEPAIPKPRVQSQCMSHMQFVHRGLHIPAALALAPSQKPLLRGMTMIQSAHRTTLCGHISLLPTPRSFLV
jgi:hypothetical protein